MKYVLAGNFREYKDWLEKTNTAPRKAKYVSSPAVLRGTRLRPDDVVYLSGRYQHPQYAHIVEELRVRTNRA